MGSLSSNARQGERSIGYTLIELLIVMLVLGILASIVALNMRPHHDAGLRTDATRLAELFSLAADEAQVRSRTIVWQANDNGYQFLVQGDRGFSPLEDEHFRARQWTDGPIEARLTAGRLSQDDSSGIQIPFARDGVQPPFTLELHAGDGAMALAADGIGHYVVNAVPQ